MREATEREKELVGIIAKGGEGEVEALTELIYREIYGAGEIKPSAFCQETGEFLAAHLLPALRANRPAGKLGRTKGAPLVQKSFELEGEFLAAIHEVREGRVQTLAATFRDCLEAAISRLEKGKPDKTWRARWEVLAGSGEGKRRPVLVKLPVALVDRGKALVVAGKIPSLIDLVRMGGLLMVEEHQAASVEARIGGA